MKSEQRDGLRYSAYWGSGMTEQLKSVILRAIDDGQVFYGNDYEKHADYISKTIQDS